MQTNSNITIYNRYRLTNNSEDRWQRTQVQNVAWEQTHARTQFDSADLATVFIPMARGTNYLAPRVWQALSTKTGKWTLQVGDVIVKGLVSDELSAALPLGILKAAHDDVLVITSVDTRDFGIASMQHWQVGAK